MAISDISLQKKVDIAASFVGDNFLRVAKALRKLQDDDPEMPAHHRRVGAPQRRVHYILHPDVPNVAGAAEASPGRTGLASRTEDLRCSFNSGP